MDIVSDLDNFTMNCSVTHEYGDYVCRQAEISITDEPLGDSSSAPDANVVIDCHGPGQVTCSLEVIERQKQFLQYFFV